MFSRGPAFNIVTIDLSTAGAQTFNQVVGSLTFVRATDSNGVLALGAEVNIQLGDASGQIIPAAINTMVKLSKPVNAVVFSWDAQPGLTATFMVAPDDAVIIHSPPAEQLVTQSMGTTLAASGVAVGTGAVQLVPAASRQSVLIQNNGAADIFVGSDSTVTTASGFRVPANGGVLTVDHTTAALWAISGTAGQDVRVLVEA